VSGSKNKADAEAEDGSIQVSHRESALGSAADASRSASVAVVIPCRNCEKWVGRAIESALNQAPAAVIVVDDGSTDASLDVVRSFGEKVHWETGPGEGAPAARNRGLARVSADHVMFLDADDYVEGELFSGMVEAAWAASADIVFGPFLFEREADGSRREGWRIDSAVDSAEALACAWLEGSYIPPCAVLWRTGFVNGIGGWSRALQRNQDGELVLRGLFAGARWAVSRGGAGIYFQHGSANRISENKSIQGFEARMSVLDGFSRNEHSSRLKRAFARAYYNLARSAYREGFAELGGEALVKSGALGFPGHHGTFAHRLAASLLGLQTKERLGSRLKRPSRTI
jgi:glycosyltransferase involved in cell wall biosynthesis